MKVIKCPFCDRRFDDQTQFSEHLEKKHNDEIPKDMEPYQYYVYLKTGKDHGTCVMCKKDTKWNPKTMKYHRFCENPTCREKYIEMFRTRMIGKYGKVTLLNDPEQQKKMLANRKISGEYVWSDHIHKTPYTGSYEKEFLKFLDLIMDFPPSDVIAPSPHTYYYEYEGTKHFYIPDFFIPSLDLEIEIKDGGDNPNNHHKIQDVDKVKERLKDEVMQKNGALSYLKIENKDHKKFLDFLMLAKKKFWDNDKSPIFMP
jgi:hypothetical protein